MSFNYFTFKALLCGPLGFEDFMRPDWMKMVLTWPDKREGCFKLDLFEALVHAVDNELSEESERRNRIDNESNRYVLRGRDTPDRFPPFLTKEIYPMSSSLSAQQSPSDRDSTVKGNNLLPLCANPFHLEKIPFCREAKQFCQSCLSQYDAPGKRVCIGKTSSIRTPMVPLP